MNKSASDKNDRNDVYVGILLAEGGTLSTTSSPPLSSGKFGSLLGYCLLALVFGMVLGSIGCAFNLLCFVLHDGPLDDLAIFLAVVLLLILTFCVVLDNGKDYGDDKEDNDAEKVLTLTPILIVLGYTIPNVLFLVWEHKQPINFIIEYARLNRAIALPALPVVLGVFALALMLMLRVLGVKFQN